MTTAIEDKLLDILRSYLSPIVAKSILSLSASLAQLDLNDLRDGDKPKLLDGLKKGLQTYVPDTEQQGECLARLSELLAAPEPTKPLRLRPVVIQIREETDIVMARGRGTEMSSQLGFPRLVQVKVATAISELARNIVQYAGQGEITITSISNGIEIVARDHGPGIADIETVLSGNYSSKTGMGMGLAGTKKLMDDFEVETKPGLGTEVRIRKFL